MVSPTGSRSAAAISSVATGARSTTTGARDITGLAWRTDASALITDLVRSTRRSASPTMQGVDEGVDAARSTIGLPRCAGALSAFAGEFAGTGVVTGPTVEGIGVDVDAA